MEKTRANIHNGQQANGNANQARQRMEAQLWLAVKTTSIAKPSVFCASVNGGEKNWLDYAAAGEVFAQRGDHSSAACAYGVAAQVCNEPMQVGMLRLSAADEYTKAAEIAKDPAKAKNLVERAASHLAMAGKCFRQAEEHGMAVHAHSRASVALQSVGKHREATTQKSHAERLMPMVEAALP